ncbi:MAG TPA: TetR/AcrR family transcriptional regulator [Gammaproteobacteria bacterium]|nr:TetR/AcrR family transcriptional regulator [Gammaproteobacteria bacterium]
MTGSGQDLTTLRAFEEWVDLSRQAICREIYARNSERIGVKKEATAVRNLSRIIDATLRLANEKGFQAMTLRDLSGETGMSMGGLYTYIGSKDELVRLIQSHGRLLTERVMHDSLEAVTGAVPRLSAAIRAHVYLTEVLHPWFYFSFMESRHLGRREIETAIQGELASEAIFADILAEGQQAGLFRRIDVALTAASIKALMQDWYLKRWKYSRRGVGAEAFASHLIAFVLAYVGFAAPGDGRA